ncbi:MAG: alcohol dehydrogenase catalytic domain-containing protein [Thermoplasmata archaeon]|uniref:Alcohol dehydrogenase catalytic domain-containing protein n=1 Tax=Candidatus Sysuiplasma superficiale TaxID=2823368 RepID=A0A8J7YNH0_9ARCH|nr:alcohol dehydrogenase catalytic domain-containing protein [Candidatus Sysuiplasma superficiale]
MTAVGVCGSDIHVYNGTESYPRNSPVVLGHEMAGIVDGVGNDVRHVKTGDRVVCETANYVCGECYNCRKGNYNLCPHRIGFGALSDGGMAEFLVVREDILHRIPEGVDDVAASLTEPTCVAFNATSSLGKIEPADSILIIGPGPIGLLCLQVAMLRSPSATYVLGIKADQDRLKLALELGADEVFDDPSTCIEKMKVAGWGDGVDVVIDASGISATLKTALDAVRPGGRIVKVGWGPDIPTFNLDQIVSKAVELRGSFSHNWETWERVLKLMKRGKLNPSLIAKPYSFDMWRNAFEDMEKRRIAKAVIVI